MRVSIRLTDIFKYVAVLIFIFALNQSYAQDRREKFNFLMAGVGGGATLFFGDMSDGDNPFTKYFTVQQGWAGSLSLHKRLTPYLAVNAQGTIGNLQGQRTSWSNGTPTSLEFKSNMKEAQVNFELNLLNIINPKPRFLNFYLKAGAGYVFYDATKTDFSTNLIVNQEKGNAYVVPWGFGGRLDFNERFGFYGETTFNHTFSDALDAHDAKSTTANDIYTYTSFGITYKMFPKERTSKKPSLEQDRREKFNYWMVGIGEGATLFFGDMSDDVDNPFSKYFTVQQGWAGSLSLHKRLNPYFAVNAQGTFGNWQGRRTRWSDDSPTSLEFKSNMNEAQLNFELNLLNILNPKPRFIDFYLKAGAGYVFYDATKTDFSTNLIVNQEKGSAFVVPWGFGGRLDFNERWGFYGETTFNHAFSDALDAHDSKWTDVNDLYTYTSFGITYKMFPQKRTAKVKEIEIIPADTPEVAVIEFDKFNIKVKAPKVVEPGQEFVMKIQIDKDARNESAKLQQTLPLGFTAEVIDPDGGLFQFKDQISNVTWEAFPEDPESLFVEYKVKVDKSIDEKEYIIPGIIFYNENGEEKIHQFRVNLKVERPVVAVIPDTPDTTNTPNTNTSVDVNTSNSDISENVDESGITYRVQIKAIYGGKSSPETIAKAYGITEKVYEDYHNGYMKYTTGNYSTYQEAADLKQQLRGSNVPGAFVVAYKNGKRVNNIQDAIKESASGTSSSSSNVATKGTTYRIQVAASSRDFSTQYIKTTFGLTYDVTKEKHNGLFKYTIGNYSNYTDAKTTLGTVKGVVNDAFIVKYVDGKR